MRSQLCWQRLLALGSLFWLECFYIVIVITFIFRIVHSLVCSLVCLSGERGSLCSAPPILGLEPLFVLGQALGICGIGAGTISGIL